MTLAPKAARRLDLFKSNLGHILDLSDSYACVEFTGEARGKLRALTLSLSVPISGTSSCWSDTFPAVLDVRTLRLLDISDGTMPGLWRAGPVELTTRGAVSVLHSSAFATANGLAEQLDDIRKSMRRLGWNPSARVVVLVSPDKAFRVAKGRKLDGYCRRWDRLIVIPEANARDHGTLAHEMTHLSGPAGKPGVGTKWLEEGACEFMAWRTEAGSSDNSPDPWALRELRDFEIGGWPESDHRNYSEGQLAVSALVTAYGLASVRQLVMASRSVEFAEACRDVLGVSAAELQETLREVGRCEYASLIEAMAAALNRQSWTSRAWLRFTFWVDRPLLT